ncbi:hypothetical protein [Streptomyces sp. NPDC058953]|uniref:hypothetical protein n=1 Tax=unclassified Streptomyces TaxID=2593676 RepID=UPI00369C740F
MTQNHSNDFIRGAAQTAAVEGILPRERHTPAPPAPVPADSGTAPGPVAPTVPPVIADPAPAGRTDTKAPIPPAEGILPRERHTPAPPAPSTNPSQPPTTPPVTPVDSTTTGDSGAPATDGAATPPTTSPEPSADEEIVTMERHTPSPPRPRD